MYTPSVSKYLHKYLGTEGIHKIRKSSIQVLRI